MHSFAVTRKGRNHLENEDHHLADDRRGLYIVADGIGSSRGAGTASALVVAELSARIDAGMPQAFRAAARRLAAEGGRSPQHRDMATGATLLLVAGGMRHLAHVGDARCYLVHGGAVTQLTRDHSVAWEQFEAGAITRDALRGHPNQRLLTRSFHAAKDFVVPDFLSAPLAPGDAFLLTTDGITKEVTEECLAAIVGTRPCSEWPAALLLAAGAAEDDATVVAVGP